MDIKFCLPNASVNCVLESLWPTLRLFVGLLYHIDKKFCPVKQDSHTWTIISMISIIYASQGALLALKTSPLVPFNAPGNKQIDT